MNDDVLREINRSAVVTGLSETVQRFADVAPPPEKLQNHLASAEDMLALTAGRPAFPRTVP